VSKQQTLLDEIYEEFCTCRGIYGTNEEQCFKMYLEKYAKAAVKHMVKKFSESILNDL
jgi:hypothetical protein